MHKDFLHKQAGRIELCTKDISRINLSVRTADVLIKKMCLLATPRSCRCYLCGFPINKSLPHQVCVSS